MLFSEDVLGPKPWNVKRWGMYGVRWINISDERTCGASGSEDTVISGLAFRIALTIGNVVKTSCV